MRDNGSRFLISCFCLIFLLSHASGRTSAATDPAANSTLTPASKTSTTFRSESRLVVVDVVVTKHREPVTGLTQSDFQVLEDGKRQQIQFFEAHIPSTSTQKAALPEHQYSNLSDETPSSINVVLFDLLNTPLTDQPYAREQMVQFLKTLPPGRQVALFELGGTLRMLAGFRATSDELLAAARKVVPHRSALLDTQESREEAQDQIGLARDGSMNQEFFDRMADFLAETTAARDQDRAKITLQALNDISHAVSGFRGRKNLIWLSEEFPVYFGPQMNASDPSASARNYFEVMHDTAGLLSSAQISIYPIDVRGLITGLTTASSGGGDRGNERIRPIEDLHLEMDNLARETGGRAYYDTNDLKLAMQRSIENGSRYYTIAYVPQRQNWDSKYHHIKIQLARSGLDAEYRKGYFAKPQKDRPTDQARADLISALQPATPQSTMLSLRAKVSLPDSDHPKVRIDCIVDGSALAFTAGDGNRETAHLQFETVAWSPDLKVKANASHIVELSLPQEKYEQVVHNGLAAHQELALAPGIYNIRVGVLDDGNKKIGTLDIPLRVNEVTKAAQK
jgi:VWFA-related protein